MIDWRKHLVAEPATCHGQLRAAGTRVFVTNILDSLAEGASHDEVLRSYPSLKEEHIDAAIAYAAELAREETLLPVSSMIVLSSELMDVHSSRPSADQRLPPASAGGRRLG